MIVYMTFQKLFTINLHFFQMWMFYSLYYYIIVSIVKRRIHLQGSKKNLTIKLKRYTSFHILSNPKFKSYIKVDGVYFLR